MAAKTRAESGSEGMYPQADPTAPGGMSKANLRLELAERHGITMSQSRPMSWPKLIDAVIAGRQAEEKRAKAAKEVAQVTAERHGADVFSGASSSTEEAHEEQDTNVNDSDASYFDELDDEPEPTEGETIEGDDMWNLLDDDSADADLPADVDPMEDDFDDLADLDDDEEDLTPIDGGLDTEIEAVEEIEEVEDDEDEGVLFDPETLFAEMAEAHEAEQASKPVLFLGIPGIKDYVFDGHAGAGPSASERWISCTMSLSASRRFLETLTPNQQAEFAGAGTAARQGTTAHAAAEVEANLMLGRVTPDEAEATLLELTVEPEVEDEAYDDEMAEYITEYVDLVRGYASDRGIESIRIESRVEAGIPLDGMHEGEVYVIRGSGDFIALPTLEEPDLVVGDLKYGEGVFVDVEENPQVRLYALGALEELVDDEGNLTVDVQTVTYYIAQPRLGGLRTWTESLDDLLDWREQVLSPALTKALYGADEGATYEPSPAACQWCPARGTCPALAEQRIEQAAGLFETVAEHEFDEGVGAPLDAETLSDERLGDLLRQVEGLVDLRKDLRAEAQRRLYRGTPVPGYQLVNYTPPRKWNDDATSRLDPMVQADEGGLLTPKQRALLWKSPTLLTPTQAESVLGKEGYALIEEIVVKPDKRPVIAPEGDRRKTWGGPPPEQMFPDADEEE